VIDFSPKSPYKYVCSVDSFVIQGPGPGSDDEDDNWLVAIDMGLTDGYRGFQQRKELAYELSRYIRQALPEAGFKEKEFVHFDVDMELLYYSIEKHKADGSEVDVAELKEFVKKAVDAINQKNSLEQQPLIAFVEKTWEDLALSQRDPKHARGWSKE